MPVNPIWTGLSRGLHRHCPACGQGKLYVGFLRIRERCEACGADNTVYPSDDLPPYLTILVTGHLIVPLMFWVDHAVAPALWIQFTIWLPLTTLLCLALMRPVKGAVIGLCWALGVARPGART